MHADRKAVPEEGCVGRALERRLCLLVQQALKRRDDQKRVQSRSSVLSRIIAQSCFSRKTGADGAYFCPFFTAFGIMFFTLLGLQPIAAALCALIGPLAIVVSYSPGLMPPPVDSALFSPLSISALAMAIAVTLSAVLMSSLVLLSSIVFCIAVALFCSAI